jgi:hypothetical protein
MTESETYVGTVCDDCAMMIANDEAPCDRPEAEVLEYLARVDAGYVGVECVSLDYGDCDEFSRARCDLCAETLAGRRHSATFFLLALEKA